MRQEGIPFRSDAVTLECPNHSSRNAKPFLAARTADGSFMVNAGAYQFNEVARLVVEPEALFHWSPRHSDPVLVSVIIGSLFQPYIAEPDEKSSGVGHISSDGGTNPYDPCRVTLEGLKVGLEKKGSRGAINDMSNLMKNDADLLLCRDTLSVEVGHIRHDPVAGIGNVRVLGKIQLRTRRYCIQPRP